MVQLSMKVLSTNYLFSQKVSKYSPDHQKHNSRESMEGKELLKSYVFQSTNMTVRTKAKKSETRNLSK